MRLSDAQRLAESLMSEHLWERADGYHWDFAFDRASRRFGATHWKRLPGCEWEPHKITLSQKMTLLNDEETVRQTILHEIAHALAGHDHNHDAHWRRLAVSIGGDGARTCGTGTVSVEPGFVGTCPSCDLVVKRHRRKAAACSRCRRKGLPATIVWRRNPAATEQRASLAQMSAS